MGRDLELDSLRALSAELVSMSLGLASTAKELTILGEALIHTSKERGHQSRSTLQGIRLRRWLDDRQRQARQNKTAA